MKRNDDDRGGTGPGKSQGTSGGAEPSRSRTSRPDDDRAPRSRGASADGRGGKQPGAGSGRAGERPQASDGRPPDERGKGRPYPPRYRSDGPPDARWQEAHGPDRRDRTTSGRVNDDGRTSRGRHDADRPDGSSPGRADSARPPGRRAAPYRPPDAAGGPPMRRGPRPPGGPWIARARVALDRRGLVPPSHVAWRRLPPGPGRDRRRKTSSGPTRRSWPAADRSKRLSQRGARPSACSSSRNAGRRSTSSSSMPPRCASRSSRSKGARSRP